MARQKQGPVPQTSLEGRDGQLVNNANSLVIGKLWAQPTKSLEKIFATQKN